MTSQTTTGEQGSLFDDDLAGSLAATFSANTVKGRRDRHARRRQGAGILFRHAEADGTVWFFLAQRSMRVGHGLTWAVPGGTVDRGEHPLAAAGREFTEELDLPLSTLDGATIVAEAATRGDSHDYTTYLVDLPAFFDPAYDALGWETEDADWFTADGVDALPLHSGFAQAWKTLRTAPAVTR